MRFKLSDITVEPFMFLSMNIFFLNLVALPQIILDNVCLLKHNETTCRAMFAGLYKEHFDVVQEQSTLWFGGLLVIATLITVLTLPFVGTISDKYGRYVAMFLSPVGQILQTLALLGIAANGLEFPTWILLLVGPIPGLVGDVSGLYVLTGSYISDITSEKTRTLRISLLEAAGMIAALSATVSSGFIIEAFGYVGIFVTSTVLIVLALVYLSFCVKPLNRTRKESSRLMKTEGLEMNLPSDKEEIKTSLPTQGNVMDFEDGFEEELKTDTIVGKAAKLGACPVYNEGGISIARSNVNQNGVKESKVSVKTGIGNISDRCDSDLVRYEDVHGNKTYMSEEAIVETTLYMNGNMVDGAVGVRSERSGNEVIGNKDGKIGQGWLEKEAIGSKTLPSFSTEASTVEPNEIKLALERCEDDLSHKYTIGDNKSLAVSHEGISTICDRRSTDNDTCLRAFENEGLSVDVKVISEGGCEKTPIGSQLCHILKESNPIQNLRRVFSILKAEGQVVNGLILFLLMFFSAMTYSGEISVLTLFLKNGPFYFNPRALGLYLAFESAAIAILGMIIFNFLFTKVIKMDDYILLLVSFCSNAVYFILLAFAQSLLMLYMIQLIHAVGSLNTCVIRSLITKIVPVSTVGLLFGALLMFETAGILFGSMICPIVYSRVAATQPGAVFLLNFSLVVINVVITLVFIIKYRKKGQNNMQNQARN